MKLSNLNIYEKAVIGTLVDKLLDLNIATVPDSILARRLFYEDDGVYIEQWAQCAERSTTSEFSKILKDALTHMINTFASNNAWLQYYLYDAVDTVTTSDIYAFFVDIGTLLQYTLDLVTPEMFEEAMSGDTPIDIVAERLVDDILDDCNYTRKE